MNYRDKRDRVQVWGLLPSYSGSVIAELLIVDSSVSSAKCTLLAEDGSELRVVLPQNVLRNDFPSAYNMVLLKLQ